MAKKELEEQLKSYEGYINDIPLVIDPCKQCKVFKENKGYEFEHKEINGGTITTSQGRCKECCWFYDSKFEMEVDDNSCATCRHKAKMLTDKKPCKDCDNGCNWEK
jgi:hypothetical protein